MNQGYIEVPRSVFSDSRGYFEPVFDLPGLSEKYDFRPVQINLSTSKYGVMRGLHLQRRPYAQKKLVTVLSGEILDFYVNVNPEALDYGVLNTNRMVDSSNPLLLGSDYAHGFISLRPNSRVLYAVSAKYSPEHEVVIESQQFWEELKQILGADWPSEIVRSQKDSSGQNFSEFRF